MMQLLNSAQLEALVAQGKPVIVDFFATWCQPCKMMPPAVDALSQELAGQAEVVKVDIEEGYEVAAKLGVRGVPTFVVFKDGRRVATRSGAAPRDALMNWAKGALV